MGETSAGTGESDGFPTGRYALLRWWGRRMAISQESGSRLREDQANARWKLSPYMTMI